MDFTFETATDSDVSELAGFIERQRSGLPRNLGREFGRRRIVATLRLATKKPWAIDTTYFTAVRRPLYLTSMAVRPRAQRKGVGRRLLQEAAAVARAWPADAIRLDAFDAAAGAAPFYAKCAFCEIAHVRYKKSPLVYFELLLPPLEVQP
jgi:GNAT superfamily N-acetyltransferase